MIWKNNCPEWSNKQMTLFKWDNCFKPYSVKVSGITPLQSLPTYKRSTISRNMKLSSPCLHSSNKKYTITTIIITILLIILWLMTITKIFFKVICRCKNTHKYHLKTRLRINNKKIPLLTNHVLSTMNLPPISWEKLVILENPNPINSPLI